MNRVVVDPATLARLRGVRQTLELCDESGRVVGHFVPALEHSEDAGLGPNGCAWTKEDRASADILPPHPLPGRCQGMLTILCEDDEHLKDWAEYMP